MNKLTKTLVIIGLVGIVGVASAALIVTFVQVNGELNGVQQSVVFGNDDTSKTFTINDPIAGNTYEQNYNLKNRSDVIVPVVLDTTSAVGIETTYWSSVVLENKDAAWNQLTEDGVQGTLVYQLIANKFNFEFEATGLVAGESYSLIYYADKSDRMVDWGGNNPGGLIATFTTDVDGKILNATGSENLDMNLASGADANLEEYDYCDSDGYNLCHGAKVWLVQTSNYNATTKTVETWDPGMFLFETDLITYSDTNVDGSALNLGTGTLNIIIRNVLDSALAPGTYPLTTTVNPL